MEERMIGSYEIVYSLSNILGIYAIYLFIHVFYGEEVKSARRDLVLFGLFYLVNVSMYLFVGIPIIIMMCSLIGIFLLAFSREFKLKKALITTLYVYVILVFVETFVVIVTNFVRLPITEKYDYTMIWGVVSIHVLNYTVVLIIRNFVKARRGSHIPTSYWLALLFMPASSLYILIGIIGSDELSTVQIAVRTALVLVMNFVMFFLYDAMVSYYETRVKEAAARQLNRSYIRQFEVMNDSNKKVKSFRHDVKRHMAALQSLLESSKATDAKAYISEMIGQLDNESLIANTGNLIIDSVINFELDKALANSVQVEMDAELIPPKLNVTDFDMTIILSNLLSNAYQATLTIPDDRKIVIKLKYDKGMFYVMVKNSFDGNLIYKDDTLQTIKKDKANHGMGLGILSRTIEKYEGEMKIEHEENVFSVEAFMYV